MKRRIGAHSEPEKDHDEDSPQEEARRAVLMDAWEANRFRHFAQSDIRCMFTIGQKKMTRMMSLGGADGSTGVPHVSGKINPDHFKQWLWENREAIRNLK